MSVCITNLYKREKRPRSLLQRYIKTTLIASILRIDINGTKEIDFAHPVRYNKNKVGGVQGKYAIDLPL